MHMGVKHNFHHLALQFLYVGNQNNAVYRFCKSYTVLKIHTIADMNRCMLCT